MPRVGTRRSLLSSIKTRIINPVLLYDTFTDANGTLLTAHAMNVGPGWTDILGSMQIQSDQAAFSGNLNSYCVVASDAGQADVTCSCVLNTAPTGIVNAYLCVNLAGVNQSTYWTLSAELDGGNSNFRLIEFEANGSWTVRETGGAISNNTSYALKLVTNGDTITAYVNGTPMTPYTITNRPLKTNTMCGLFFYRVTPTPDPYSDNGSTFSDFLVTG